jgi:hypothetical protein
LRRLAALACFTLAGSMVPDKDLVLGAYGKATVVQDDLDNTYQKLD